MVRRIYALVIAALIINLTLNAQAKRFEADKKQSEISYKLTHPLHEIDAVSKDASVWIDLNQANRLIQKAFVQIPVTSFNSGNSNRDSHAMEVIDAITYPEVRFTSTSISQKGDSLKITGNLTFHGVTKPVSIYAAEAWNQDNLTVNGKFDISLTAFKVDRPSLLGVPVKDDLQFTFKQIFNVK
ncbi:MAG: YceI family protein [Acidobacteriota bacterium]